jgi:hypothetical protein
MIRSASNILHILRPRTDSSWEFSDTVDSMFADWNAATIKWQNGNPVTVYFKASQDFQIDPERNEALLGALKAGQIIRGQLPADLAFEGVVEIERRDFHVVTIEGEPKDGIFADKSPIGVVIEDPPWSDTGFGEIGPSHFLFDDETEAAIFKMRWM